jgi:hypothetical protein
VVLLVLGSENVTKVDISKQDNVKLMRKQQLD